jgi:hypothetical protein
MFCNGFMALLCATGSGLDFTLRHGIRFVGKQHRRHELRKYFRDIHLGTFKLNVLIWNAAIAQNSVPERPPHQST